MCSACREGLVWTGSAAGFRSPIFNELRLSKHVCRRADLEAREYVGNSCLTMACVGHQTDVPFAPEENTKADQGTFELDESQNNNMVVIGGSDGRQDS